VTLPEVPAFSYELAVSYTNLFYLDLSTILTSFSGIARYAPSVFAEFDSGIISDVTALLNEPLEVLLFLD